MRHLVIGSSGQIGVELLNLIHNKNEEVIGTFYNTSPSNLFTNQIPPGRLFKLDITNQKSIEKLLIEINPDVIYIAAANNNIDYCELNKKASYLINYIGPTNIVISINNIREKLNRKKEPLLVFYSSDQIFNGEKGLYSETDVSDPINIYGRHKLLAEDYIEKESKHYIIIRTSCVFSMKRDSFINELIKTLNNNKEINICDNEFITPTYAFDLVEATLRLVENIGYGLRNIKNPVANLVGSGYTSRYNFAADIAEIFNYNINLIKPVNFQNLNLPAKRPLKSGLNIDVAENLIGRKMLHYKDGLIDLKKNM